MTQGKHILFPALNAFLAALLAGCPPLETPDLSPRPAPGEQHLLRLAHITDPQIVDEESPARSVRTEDVISVSWRPQEAWAVHTLDATLQRINAINAAGPPVDFVLMTGDLIDLAQYNELQWFVDTMDGKVVTVDSGALDGLDRHPDPAINPKLPYSAAGLDPSIPWYTCYGNHDGLAVGNFPIDRTAPRPAEWFAPLLPIAAEAMGFHLIDPAWDFMLPTADVSPAVILGGGPPLAPGSQQVDLSALEAGPIPPDPARRFLSPRDFVALHLASSGRPAGHGFTRRALTRGETWYSARPIPGAPLRLIVFDTVASGPHYGLPLFYGALLREHFETFVVPELEAAHRAGDWVILASHHPSVEFSLPFPGQTVSTEEFRAALAKYPGVLMHLVGHTHRNHASIIPGANPYLEIETGAIIDYPQEGRILDVFIAADGESARVESRMFSHAENPTTQSAESYRRARIDWGLRKLEPAATGRTRPDAPGSPGDRAFTVTLRR